MSEIRLDTPNVFLIEGHAHELVPNAESAIGMHGFVIMVPPGDDHEWFLDLLWRVTVAYDCMPNMLASRTMVRNVVETVMSSERRERELVQRPERKHGGDELSRPDRPVPAKACTNPTPITNAEIGRAHKKAKSTRAPRGTGKPSARKEN